jgi:RNA polymerase sigma factor (sigma-70 family)
METRESKPPFDEAFSRVRKNLFTTAKHFCGWNVEDAEDLLQETRIKAWKAYDSLLPGSNFYVWSLRILRNAAVDRAKRYKSRISAAPLTSEMEAEAMFYKGNSNLPRIDEDEICFMVDLERTVSELASSCRDVIMLTEVLGCTQPEAAVIMGKTVQQVKSLKSKSVEAIKEKWVKEQQP